MRKDSAFLNDFEERQHEISGNPKEFRARRDPSNLAAVMSLAGHPNLSTEIAQTSSQGHT
jgi:hypothetical protein